MLAERRDSDGSRADAAAALGERLRAAEAEMEVPAGLWERVRATDERTQQRPSGPRLSTRLGDLLAARSATARSALIAVAAAAVALVGGGGWWLLAPSPGANPAHRPSASTSAMSPARHGIPLRVHNIETPCRKLHTLECALRLAKDPFEPYALSGNSAGHVWHGQKLQASCVVTDGRLVTDEHGISSSRWYLVRTHDGETGWLPGVRTRNSRTVPDCTKAERKAH
jgi:hypothetical protein